MSYLITDENTITVDYEGSKFTFKIPSIMESARIGVRAKMMRKEVAPESDGSEDGLDIETIYIFKALSTFEILLKKTDAPWVFTPGEDGKPKIDVNKFEDKHLVSLIDVYLEYSTALRNFRTGGVQPAESSNG